MTKKFKKLFFALAVMMLIMPVASVYAAMVFEDDFNGSFDENWYFVNYEDGGAGVLVKSPGVMCGNDACASLMSSGSDQFLRVQVNSSTTDGVYTNTDVSEVEIGDPAATDSGPWTPTYGHPVVLETRVRWSAIYNQNGTGDAVGTNGVILWNSAIGESGPTSEYDTIGFVWSDSSILFGYLAGLSAVSVTNLLPLSVSKPLWPVNIHDWVDLKMIWSVNILGVQTAKYYVNNHLIGIHILPVPLEGMSVEVWNDNQQPNVGLGGPTPPYVFEYPSPAEDQWIDVDFVRVTQN